MKFWESLQALVDKSEVHIDRPRSSAHPRYSDYIYPFDYGYLQGTSSSDGGGIDCWVGSIGGKNVTGIVNVIDLVKGDSEIKILLGCTEDDMDTILQCHQRGAMAGLLVKNK